jgi:hypothetical protein
METRTAVELLTALGHESRLAIFRPPVETCPDAMNANPTGERQRMASATLSFHRAHLGQVGPNEGRRESRFIPEGWCERSA